ncbi:MAG: glycosyltransferase [Halioglobus sp.]
MREVDVVIPVYDGYEETRSCLESVLESVDFSWAQLVLVNDCSPNPEITRYLRALSDEHSSVTLLENAENLGFVATANRGMSHSPQRDVLLLNSDVEVAGDWLTRLREAAYQHQKVASITPFSNNATICSFPNFCKDNQLLFGLSVGELDDFFAENFTADDVIPVPTGVGFCMYMPREGLDKIGYFDLETFGKGYGEENDWCQRALKAGWKNLHLANCFVYHKGGVSFGTEHNPRITRAQDILDQKYPQYHADIQKFIAADAGREFRMQAILGLFALQHRPKVLLVTHKLGGGAQQHVDELASQYQDEALFLQITPDKDGESITLTGFDGGQRLMDGLYFDVGTEYDALLKLLRELGIGRVHFHHTMGLHPRLWLLADDLDCGYDLTIHDYYLINGNPTLTDDNARYVSEAAPEFDERCAGHYPLPPEVTADHWRNSQKLLVEGADRVIFPSDDCCLRFRKFFDVENALVAWHPDYLLSQPYPEPHWQFPEDRPLKVLVMGALSREKGADELEGVALAMQGQAIEFHLLGYAYRALAKNVVTHGPYDNSDVYSLVEAINPDVVWFPAQWPETYSYTLSIAMHAGKPVVVPDIGAFVERVQGRALSVLCPWDKSVADWAGFWGAVLTDKTLPEAIDVPAGEATPVLLDRDFYRSSYLQAVPARIARVSAETLQALVNNYKANGITLSFRERLLNRIWRFCQSPLIAWFVSFVPFRVQQALKRRLSARPIHDIVRR